MSNEKAIELLEKLKGDLHYYTTVWGVDDIGIDDMEETIDQALAELEKQPAEFLAKNIYAEIPRCANDRLRRYFSF